MTAREPLAPELHRGSSVVHVRSRWMLDSAAPVPGLQARSLCNIGPDVEAARRLARSMLTELALSPLADGKGGSRRR